MPASTGALAVVGATILDGNGGKPLENGVIVAEGGRIVAVGGIDTPVPPDTRRIDARGKYVIPGLMNANVHLYAALTLERLVRHVDHFEDVISESAQVALKNGLTTVFDTWGPRRALMNVQQAIDAGRVAGARFFFAGNIIGFDGPLSRDFNPKFAEVCSPSFVSRIEAMWVENVGRHLMWLTPEEVGRQVRSYIDRGIDFVKYGSNEHCNAAAGAFIQFSPRQQAAIVEEAHRAGKTAQAHAMSVEGLRLAVEAGCDLITHCNFTGPTPIPLDTLEMMAERKTGAVVFPWTEKGLQWVKANVSDDLWTFMQSANANARNLIRSGAPLMLANDGMIRAPEGHWMTQTWSAAPRGESLISLAEGHFFWFRAMEELGCAPMAMLQAATRNIAVAYGKERDLGTLEIGKVADMLILDEDPLAAAANYQSIHAVIKGGEVIDRESLPSRPILTAPLPAPVAEQAFYIPAVSTGPRLPGCPMCMGL